MATRRPAPKSPADEMVENKRRAMRAELAESLGYGTARRLKLNDLVRHVHPEPQAQEMAHGSHANTRQVIGQVRRMDATEPQRAVTSPYVRGKSQQPQQVTAGSVRRTQPDAGTPQDLAQSAAKRSAGR